MSPPDVAIVDDEEEIRRALAQGLDLAGFRVVTHARPEDALAAVSGAWAGVVVSDIRMPGMDGVTFMKALLEVDKELPVILMTGHGDVPLAVEAMRSGAYDFIEKPFAVNQLTNIVGHALEKRRLVIENRSLRAELKDRSGLESSLIGRTAAIEQLRQHIVALADTSADILLLGETGAGKEVVARALHTESSRKAKPFVAINCGALPAEIIESELFGHEAGAFTGANKKRTGKLQHADGGTVFLDEIESMPLDLQVKMLRAIETRAITPLGSNAEIPLDLRFVAASKADLAAESVAGRFRQDLYYRLNVLSMDIPPLRERKEDIPLLFHHLVADAAARYRREPPAVTPAILSELQDQEWPGNVRELRNIADRFVLGMWPPPRDAGSGETDPQTLADRVGAYEKRLIAQSLQQHDGRIKPTYETLGLSRKSLYDKMKKYGLDRSSAVDDG